MRIAKVAFFIVAILALTCTGCVKDPDEPDYSLGAGDRVPRFSVTLDDGREWSSSAMQGRGAVVVFFNTGCADCRRELPVVQATYDMARAEALPVDFVCIARGEQAASIGPWWSEHGLTMPYSPQPDRRVYGLFASSGIPRIYVADGGGLIVAAYGPDSSPSAEELLRLVRGL